ncbi:MAG: MBL fold metallo-hydrolase [Anaerolineae bacterium]
MSNFICVTCGVQFGKSSTTPSHCPICTDERQFVRREGQAWTTQYDLQKTHQNVIKHHEPHLYGIYTVPSFAIGQQALLIQSEHGNVLWDCISLIDDQTVERVNQLGGVGKIALSHPHFYASAVEWGERFDATIHMHQADAEWIMRPSPRIQFWQGEKFALHPDITLIHAGGHFVGSAVCHWAAGADHQGALLTGDTIHVVADRRWVTFMRSYPNVIPLSAAKVNEIFKAVAPYAFDCLYGAWDGYVVSTDAKDAVERSAKRYIQALE